MSASQSRIPEYKNNPWMWFFMMRSLGLLFHPEDDPAEIVSSGSDAPLFTEIECEQIRGIMKRMYDKDIDPCEHAYQVGVDCGDFVEEDQYGNA